MKAAVLDAERAVLGAVLIDREALVAVQPLRADDFYLPTNRLAWETIARLHAAASPVDPITVAAACAVPLADMMEWARAVPTTANAPHYATLVRESATRRRLTEAAGLLYERAKRDDEPLADLLADAQRSINRVATEGMGAGPVRAGEAQEAAMGVLEQKASPAGALYGVPTGHEELDVLTGGLQPEKLVVVAARPGVGKTAWALRLALLAALDHGIPALFFSREMPRQELLERCWSIRSGVPARRIHAGGAMSKSESGRRERHVLTPVEWRDIERAAAAIAPAPLFIDDSTATAPGVWAEARRWRSKHAGGRAVVVVDYLGLLEPGAKYDSRQEAVAAMSRGMKQLARDLAAPVILVVQLNRDAAARTGGGADAPAPELHELRESGAIEQDADLVVFPHRDYKVPRGPAKLIVAKNRGGPIGAVPVMWDGPTMAYLDPQGALSQEPRLPGT